MFDLENDGIDHINIYSKGKTEIGRWLSNFTHEPIIVPEHGNFSSIEGYWYWLGTRNERLRTAIGFGAKQLGKSLESQFIEGFDDYIRKAIDIKLKSNRKMLVIFSLTKLPFTHYYVYGDKQIDAGHKWILEHFENRRSLLENWVKKLPT